MMENAEEIFHFLEEFSKRKPKTIPQELNEYLAYVARTGDPVYQWSLVKSLFKEKLLNVITDFYETTPSIEIPPYPNVDPFNYDIMKNSLLERLDSFTSAPFTVQRICELLTFPRKQYNRVDKFMRAVEKNILVVSTREPGHQRQPEPENGEPMEPIVNGSDNNSEYNVDVEMEDMSWKDNAAARQNAEPQPSSSDSHITVDDIEARLQAKQETSMDTMQEKVVTEYESVTPPELNITETTDNLEQTPKDTIVTIASTSTESKTELKQSSLEQTPLEQTQEPKEDIEMKCDSRPKPVVIPEIKIDDAEMTEQKLNAQSQDISKNVEQEIEKEVTATETTNLPVDESSSDSNKESESKNSSEISSSEESSSSSDNTDGNSNSPKPEEHIDVQEESSSEVCEKTVESTDTIVENKVESVSTPLQEEKAPDTIQSDNYSISDVKSELPVASVDTDSNSEEAKIEEKTSEDNTEDIKPEAPITTEDAVES